MPIMRLLSSPGGEFCRRAWLKRVPNWDSQMDLIWGYITAKATDLWRSETNPDANPGGGV